MRGEAGVATDTRRQEWSQYYHGGRLGGIEVLHARFVRHRYPRHSHEYPVVALVEHGAASFWYRGAQHTASRGRVLVINGGEPHTGDPVLSDGYLYRALYPHIDYLGNVLRDVSSIPGAPAFKGAVLDDDLLSSRLAKFHVCILEHAPSAECESALLSALALLLTRYTEPQLVVRTVGRERPAVKLAKEFIESHFSEDISISRLAGLSSLSAFYFARAFVRETGLPPHAYLESVRVRKVRELLDRGHSLVSAALLAGFADQSHLTHRFKRILGITPGQYVKERTIQPPVQKVQTTRE